MDITVKGKKPFPWRGGLLLGLVCAAIALALILLGKGLADAVGIGVNTTASEPLGLYRYEAIKLPLQRHTLVVVKVPGDLANDIGLYVPKGVALIKRIGAVAGDVLVTKGRTIYRCTPDGTKCNILGRCLTHDSQGRPLRCEHYDKTVVPKGYVYLASHGAANAFDSRYFGWVAIANVQHIAKPILTWR